MKIQKLDIELTENVVFAFFYSMVLRSEGNLKSKMLSLARTSKYMNKSSV